MSKSPGDRKVAGTLRVPSNYDQAQPNAPPPVHAGDEIAAELADHLAAASEHLQSQGLDADRAGKLSQEKFGDVQAIARRCYWIKQGDQLMFRTAVIALLVLLCLGLGVTALSSLRTQQQMAQQMATLAEQLKAVAERQQPVATSADKKPSEPPPQEITGMVYVGNPNVPAANKEVLLLNANDGTIVRRVMTDQEGHYRSGPLAAGDYCLVAAFENAKQQTPFFPFLQTAPIYVYPGLTASGHDLDVAQHVGRLSVELSRPLPRLEVGGKYTIESRLLIEVSTLQNRYPPWNSSAKMPPAWPLYIMNVGDSDRSSSGARSFLELLSSDDIEQQRTRTHFGDGFGLLPAGQASVVAAIIADVIPIGYTPPELPVTTVSAWGSVTGTAPSIVKEKRFDRDWYRAYESIVRGGSGPAQPRDFAWNLQNDDFYWMTKGLGKIWLRHLKFSGQQTEPQPKLFTHLSSWLGFNSSSGWICDVPIKSDSLTQLRIEVPDDIVGSIQHLVATTTADPDAFAKFTLGDSTPPPPDIQREITAGTHPFFRKVKISVMGTNPLMSSDTSEGSSK